MASLEKSKMKLAHLEVQPICLYLPDHPAWMARHEKGKEYFKKAGIDPLYFSGFHAERMGVQTSRVYDRDPQNIDTGWKIPPKTVGNFLSWHMGFNIMLHKPEVDYWMVLEDDLILNDDWKQRAEQAIKDTPEDFDYLILGHCCTEGVPTTHVEGEVYEVKYPQAGVPAIVSKKALATIIKYARNAGYPFDVNLHDYVFQHLKVYTLLPRLSEQEDTHLPK